LRLLVTPDTVVRWHRDLLRRRWAAKSRAGRSGRPATGRDIRRLVLCLAKESPAAQSAATTANLGEPRSPKADAIIVAPATYNTISKWAAGVSDTYALGILAEGPDSSRAPYFPPRGARRARTLRCLIRQS
jgi:hypothetical protein